MEALQIRPPGGLLYEQVAERLQGLVDNGTLRPGERLPSVRRLHRQWSVSLSTVLQAYRVLEDRGIIEARPQSGHYVRATLQRLPEPRLLAPGGQPRAVDRGDLMMRVSMAAGPMGLVRLGCGLPHPDLVPREALNRVVGRVARERSDSHAYVMSPGHERLRRVLAGRLLDAGCSVTQEQIVVTTGGQEALNLCLRTVGRAGDTVLVESPTYFGLLEILSSHGLRAVEVPTHPRLGIDVDALTAALDREQPAAVVVMANFSNPLGSLMPDPAKARLVAVCAARGVPLIEDDAYGELSFEGTRPRALKAWDRDGGVLHCGTLSKTLSPGLRVGWVAAGRYTSQVSRNKMLASLACATVPQLTAAEFLKTGGYDRHLRKLRRAYKAHVTRMSALVAEVFPPGTRLSRPRGGQFLWVELPEPCDALALFELAWDAGVSVAPGPMFSASGGFGRHLRLNCSVPWGPEVEGAVRLLGGLAGGQCGG